MNSHYQTYDRTKNSFRLQIFKKKNAFILIRHSIRISIRIRVISKFEYEYLFNISIIYFFFKIYLCLQYLYIFKCHASHVLYSYHYIKFFLLRHETKKIEESLIDGVREIK